MGEFVELDELDLMSR